MKKYMILTSVLALAACGGGHHGGTSAVPSTDPRISEDAILSNSKVTSMVSEILIAKDGSSQNIARPAAMIGGKSYMIYRLDNAKFFENDMESDDEYVSFGLDSDGKINQISYHWDDGTIESVNRESLDNSVFAENVYKYKVEINDNTYYTDSLPVVDGGYSKEKIKEAFRRRYGDEWSDEMFTQADTIIDSTDMVPTEYLHRHVVNLKGKDLPESHTLKYSDFGYITILAKEIHQEGDGVGDDNSVIFGGYEVKEIKDTTNFQNLEFTGKAIATLGIDGGNANQKIETDDTTTTLTIDANGNQILNMPFNNYYTIHVEKTQNDNESISWTGDTNIGYELDSNQSVNSQGLKVGYYGDNNIPSEAVGGIKFQNNDVEFNSAFGVKR